MGQGGLKSGKRRGILDPRNAWLWILAAVLVRGAILLLFVNRATEYNPDSVECGFVVIHDDYGYFLGPVDNYLETGSFELHAGSGKCFAGRMPGYSVPYLLVRQLAGRETGLQILIVSQFLLSCVCVWVLARLAQQLFGSRAAFYWTFSLFAVSTLTAIFDIQTVTESFSVSACILTLHFLVQAVDRGSKGAALTSGLFLGWAVFLRPFLGLLIPLLAVYLLVRFARSGRSLAGVKLAVLLVLPFALFETAWVARNYNAFGRLIPLQTSLSESYGRSYSDSWVAIRRLISAWGGDGSYWAEGSAAWWFRRADDDEAARHQFGQHVTNNGGAFTRADLEELRRSYRDFMATPEGSEEGIRLDHKIVLRAGELTAGYSAARPFRAYVLRRLISIRGLVFNSGSEYLPLVSFGKLSRPEQLLKLFYSGLYYLVLLGGVLGLWCAVLRHQQYAWLFLLVVANLLLTLTFVAPIPQARYFQAAYPVLLMFMVDFGLRLKMRWFPGPGASESARPLAGE